jgi:hypothetical protein
MAVNDDANGVFLTPKGTHNFQHPTSTLLASTFLDPYVLQLFRVDTVFVMASLVPRTVLDGLFKCVKILLWLPSCSLWYALLTVLRLCRFYASGKFADFEICCHGHVFKVHKIIICASSKYFETLCGGSFRVRSFGFTA